MKKLYKKERANMQIHTGEPKVSQHNCSQVQLFLGWAQNPTELTLSIDKRGKNIHFGKQKQQDWEITAHVRDSHSWEAQPWATLLPQVQGEFDALTTTAKKTSLICEV